MKHVICVQDLSCFGKCSLTIALPVLSSAGIQTSVLPTALLSTHTGGLGTPHIHDLKKDMTQIIKHWSTLSIPVDSIYSGYVSNCEQLQEIESLFALYPDALKVIDPVMGDHGKLYASLPKELHNAMRDMIKSADLITPNMTEAYALIEEPYQSGPYTEEEIASIIQKLSTCTKGDIVLTGVYLNEAELGCALYTRKDKQLSYCMADKIPQEFHGTGDLFTSSLLGAYLQKHSLLEAVNIAITYTTLCMKQSILAQSDERYGVHFEPYLKEYITLCKTEKR